MRVAIIGGGIAGLAAAYELELARSQSKTGGAAVDYQLFETGARLGGVISSEVVDGTLIERGPDSWLTEKPAAAALCRELGLGRDLMGSNDAERKTFIVVKNRLVAMPDGLMFLVPTKLLPTVLTPLFGIGTKLRMMLELQQPRRSDAGDESVAAMVRRHYGQQMVDRLADPLLSGIYGGGAAELSAQSVLPRLVEMEAEHGSLTRGMLERMRARGAGHEDRETPAIFTTLRGGLQQMVDALVGRLDPERVHLGAPVAGVVRDADRWAVQVKGWSENFDALIVATPAWAAGDLLRGVDRELGETLGEIPYSSSITVNLVYDGTQLDPLPEGFGFLVPRAEGRAMLACTILNRKFPGRTAAGKTVLRAFVGGVRNAALLSESDEALVELVRRELFEILSISAVPEFTEVKRWPRAMAQYTVGHGERMQRIEARVAELPGLHLAGNAYSGIGISDCVRLGRGAAKEILQRAGLCAEMAKP